MSPTKNFWDVVETYKIYKYLGVENIYKDSIVQHAPNVLLTALSYGKLANFVRIENKHFQNKNTFFFIKNNIYML